MKLENTNSVFNLGDTSFRRKTLLDDYKVILPILKNHMEKVDRWGENNEGQAIFYHSIINQTDLFDRDENDEPAKRARTLTNALVKPGLINANRQLSEVALNWINNKVKRPDKLEQWLTLKIDNIVFLRQCFKLRVYDTNKTNYFYPFRIAIELLISYEDIPEFHFFNIIHSIEPKMDDDKIREIIYNYHKVANNFQSFEEFYEENLSAGKSITPELLIKVENLFSKSEVDEQEFYEVFYNRKSTNAQKLYYKFYQAITAFKNNPSDQNLKTLIEISRNSSIKKAFGYGMNPFKLTRKKSISVEEFLELNFDNLLLSENSILFFNQFMSSKRSDLIKEYSDMTKRIFNLTGIFSFSNKLVNLTQPWLFRKITATYRDRIFLTGEEDYESYEEDINSLFYKDQSLMEILLISDTELERIEAEIRKEHGIPDKVSIVEAFDEMREQKFRSFIESIFVESKVILLLKLFKNRSPENDKKIQKLVSDAATVPTIFEYIIAIAWYYLSEKNFSIRKSVNLSLDGNFLPLTHAAGGDGDIVIKYSDFILMLEVTLMDRNAQKRGELEPVIRHATNLTVKESDKEVLTIFIADELDQNVVNLFRAASIVQLESTQQKGQQTDGVNIFSLSIEEIIHLLERKIEYQKIVKGIREHFSIKPAFVKTGWREDVLEKLLN